MKTKINKSIFLIMLSILITSCSKTDYQEDKSYETDIIGTC